MPSISRQIVLENGRFDIDRYWVSRLTRKETDGTLVGGHGRSRHSGSTRVVGRERRRIILFLDFLVFLIDGKAT